ncbi:MAG TPA: alpha/beta hydrolase [Terracidiphilus sp.]|nr:alpha/beta hydrolase [Terracidiphilus sp.]
MHLFLYLLALFAALIITGIVYQQLGARRDRRRYANGGRWIDIGGRRRLYLVQKGSGSHTVLFEAGIAATNLNWFHIQEPVSHFASTVSYDRGGLGWSSPARTARTPANIAAELHLLLESASIKSPYILVGHSFGGLVMRCFALNYPEEVTGVVLVDPMRCEEWPPLNPSKQSELNRGRNLFRVAIPFARIGVTRLAVTSLFLRSGRTAHRLAGAAGDGGKHVLSRIKDEVGKMPREVWPIIAAHWSRPENFKGMRKHVEAVPDTVREMQNAEPIQQIPVLVLTPGTSSPLFHEDLDSIGNNVQQVIATESAHWIHLDQPGLVIDSIRKMVMAAAAEPVAAAG